MALPPFIQPDYWLAGQTRDSVYRDFRRTGRVECTDLIRPWGGFFVGIARGRAGRVAMILVTCALVPGGAAGQATAAKAPAGKGSKGKGHAARKAGRLDRSFSGDGKLVAQLPFGGGRTSPNYRLPFEFAPGRVAMAQAGGGKIVLATNKALVEYLATGRPNPNFGGNGAVPVGGIAGFHFQLADVAVDSQGRVLTAGTTRPDNEVCMVGLQVPGPAPTVATIRRYLPDGRLDPSFGNEGTVNSTLGAPPATFEGKAYPDAAVGLVGIAVDAQDRPVVTGSAVAEVGICAPSTNRFQRSQAIVARLTTGGALDSSFTGGGIKTIPGISWLGLPTTTAAGVISAGTKVDPCPQGGGPEAPSVLTALASDGAIDQAFSGGGFWARPFTRVSDLAVAPSGKLILLARTIELKRGEWVESAGEAIRLRRNGTFDTSFGRRGRDEVDLPKHSSLAAIAVDRKGRVLLAGTIAHRLRHTKRDQLRFLLVRTTAAGEADADFGRGGRVTTAFGGRSNVVAGKVLVDPAGRIVVGGKFSGPSTDEAFALARYLSGK
jgi:uncharacterized delta-60 repeat protein